MSDLATSVHRDSAPERDEHLATRSGVLGLILIAAMLVSLVASGRAAAQGKADPAPSQAAPASQTTIEPSGAVPALPPSVPAARAAKNPFVIAIEGGIDEWTARSVLSRLKEAELAGADAIVIELDTPGGEMGAMLAISSAIKKCPIRTVAWVNSNAYSAGSVIALACGEIVVSDAAALGDALPLEVAKLLQAMGSPDRETEKLVGPVMADVIDSARKNGQDEVMVQGFVRRGVELWLIQHATTGQRFFVTADEYVKAVGRAPERGTPTIASVTGPVSGRSGKGPRDLPNTSSESKEPSVASSGDKSGASYIPASPSVSPELARQVDQELTIRGRATSRPNFASTPHAGQYTVLEYVSDGHGVLTFRDGELLKYQIAASRVRNEQELQAFFGATTLTRLNESWSVKLARGLSMLPVRGLLIAVFLVAMFIEMTHPGIVLPGVIAGVALVALVVPPMLVNMSAWWTLAAVLAGIGLIAIELFVVPGSIVTGALGVLLLMAGLIGAVMGGSLSSLTSGSDGLYAVATLLLALVVAGAGMWTASKYLHSVPVFNRLVLHSSTDDAPGTLAANVAGRLATRGAVKIGQVGKTITPLRPAGRAQFGEEIFDVVADLGFVDAGAGVRVVSADAFRVVVERTPEANDSGSAGGAGSGATSKA